MNALPMGCFATHGFQRDVDAVCNMIEQAKALGASDEACSRWATWLEEKIEYYLIKKPIRSIRKYQVKLNRVG